MNCWEFKNCSKETCTKCSAYPDKGLDCWKVTGTKCERGTMEKATLKEKILYCRNYEFYKQFAHKL